MKKINNWDKFFSEKITKIFLEKKRIVDIGGGLRVAKDKNNRYDKNREWILPLLKNVDYKVLDPVPDYNPDIIGDIHNLPFNNDSQDAIICMAVLEHVENPIKASEEIYRVLKPGGYCFVYIPFLYYYHAARGYYKDYWRFTSDSIDYLFRNFTKVERVAVRGAIETWINISPLGRSKILTRIAAYLDIYFGKTKSEQVSGFNIFLVK